MQPSGGPQQQSTYDYEYSDQYSQQQQQQQQPERPAIPSMRPTLEAPAFYHPSPLHQQFTPQQQTYYQPSRTPVAISQFPYAESPLEHKPIAAYQQQQQQQSDYRIQATPETRPEPPMPMERMCDVCQYPDPVLVAPNCNHIFHSRCVHVWPLDACPACATPMDQVAISPAVNMMVRPEPRSGKWTRPEEKFIDGILCEFDRQALPLAHGTPIRLVLAKMLNCSTMRLSKKFQKNALGKRTFRVTKPAKGEKALQFDQMDHARRQRELSQLEQIFRQELVDQFRRENNTDEGALVETQNLRLAVQQFWVSNFLKFAVLVGQPVMGLDVSDAKKRKRAMQLLRNGQFDELLAWNHHPSPANTASVTPMPPSTAVSASWSAGAAVFSSSVLGQNQHDSGPSIPALLQQVQPEQSLRPVKKMRTPEASADVSRFGLHPMDQSQYPQYGRLSPPASSATAFDYSQQQQQQHQQQQYPQQYQAESFLRPSSLSPYSDVRSDKPMGYANVVQHQQQQQQQQQVLPGIGAHDGAVHEHRSGFTPAAYPRAGDGYHASGTGQAAPWDDLLENMSASEANAGAGSQVVSTSQAQNGDATMQNWSNMHMM
ncbi:Carbonic anhydrase [Phytophthora cinnamomi]|uniref:Carbonic anhydrase n=1 Tax=Phytophthora cinnamomi TaxID=4785 RepID=UPI00355A499B|nr:Carbonic anhydrase [Phytophthora cinnamomi]